MASLAARERRIDKPTAIDTLPVMATVSASNAHRVLRYGQARGFAAKSVSLPSASDVRARIPAEEMYTLWSSLVRELGAPELPIQLARDAKLENLGLLGLCVMTAPTFLDSLETFARFDGLLNQDRSFQVIRERSRIELLLTSAVPLSLGVRLSHETAFAQAVAAARELCGEHVEPEQMMFRHGPPKQLRAHAAHFRCVMRFDQPHDRLVLPRAIGDVAPPLANRTLWTYLCRQAERERLALVPRALREQTRDQLARRLDDRDRTPITISIVARDLGTSERSLRRGLTLEGTSFRRVFDELRRERAMTAVERGVPLIEAALEAGFSQASSLSHASRRWFGRPPSTQRARRA